MGDGPRFVETTRKRAAAPDVDAPAEPVVVLAWHAKLTRAGEWFPLRSRITAVSRLAPTLFSAGGRETGPLDDPYLSRQPFEIGRIADKGIEIANPHGVELVVGGAPLAPGASRKIAAGELARGIDVVVGGRVVVWLTTDHDTGEDDGALFGRCRAMRELRREIRDAAGRADPVLVVGETGAGKELVARALHAAGERARGPLVVVNVAAIPSAVAAAELFGHERGAFTGAGERRAGYVERAAGGVLFLDEIGELPETIQPVLLRVLESGEIQPIGGTPRVVDVAIVAATDADLEAAVRGGRFRAPLYYRIAATTIRVPALRERGVDAALLLARFLLGGVSADAADRTDDERPWLPATLVAELMRAAWPGNVRQLRNVAHRLAAVARAGRVATAADLGVDLEARDDAPDEARSSIDDDRLVATLKEHAFQLNRTADALGVSRTHLDALIARSGRVRKAKDLSRDEIAAVVSDDVDAMAAKLEVSPRGLRLRMRQLGM